MRVTCVHCGKSFSLSDENAGAHFRCPKCQKLSPVAKPPERNTAVQRRETVAHSTTRRVQPRQDPSAPGRDEVLPLAEVVSQPDNGFTQPPSWDWSSTAAPPSSNVVLGSLSPQQPPKQKPVARRKPRRQKSAGDGDRLSRFFGGLLCAFFGLLMLAFAGLFGEYLRREHGLRWGLVSWVGRVGVLTIILGVTVTLSSFKK